jgi:hypothetical protein
VLGYLAPGVKVVMPGPSTPIIANAAIGWDRAGGKRGRFKRLFAMVREHQLFAISSVINNVPSVLPYNAPATESSPPTKNGQQTNVVFKLQLRYKSAPDLFNFIMIHLLATDPF